MADALTSGLKTYGEIRTKISVVVAVLLSICMCICGWMIILGKDIHTNKTTGTLSNISCTNNVCTATVEHSIGVTALAAPAPASGPAPASEPNKYRATIQVPSHYKDGQTIDVYYDPNNPSDITLGPAPKIFGWGLLGCAVLIVILSILFLKFFSGLSNQGKAVVGGLTAAGNISAILSKN